MECDTSMLSQASEMFINRITTYKQKLERKTLQEIVVLSFSY